MATYIETCTLQNNEQRKEYNQPSHHRARTPPPHCRLGDDRRVLYSPVRPLQSAPPIWWQRACPDAGAHDESVTRMPACTHTNTHTCAPARRHRELGTKCPVGRGRKPHRAGERRPPPRGGAMAVQQPAGRTRAPAARAGQRWGRTAQRSAVVCGGWVVRRPPRAAEPRPWQTAPPPSGRRASPAAIMVCRLQGMEGRKGVMASARAAASAPGCVSRGIAPLPMPHPTRLEQLPPRCPAARKPHLAEHLRRPRIPDLARASVRRSWTGVRVLCHEVYCPAA